MRKQNYQFSELSKKIQEQLIKNYQGDIQVLSESTFTKDGKMVLED